jgi:intraflagellar transport protein 20
LKSTTNDEIKKLKEENDAIKKQLEDKEKEVEDIKEDMESQKKNAKGTLDAKEKKLNDEIANLSRENEGIKQLLVNKQSLDSLENVIKDTAIQKDKLNEELQMSNQELELLKGNYENMQKQLAKSAEEIKRLQNDLAQATQETDKVKEILVEKEDECKQIVKDKEEVVEQIKIDQEVMKEKLDKKTEELKVVEDERDDFKDQLAKKQHELALRIKLQNLELQKLQSEQAETIDGLNKKTRELANEVLKYAAKIKMMEAERKLLEKMADTNKERDLLGQLNVERFQKEIENLKQENDRLRNAMSKDEPIVETALKSKVKKSKAKSIQKDIESIGQFIIEHVFTLDISNQPLTDKIITLNEKIETYDKELERVKDRLIA